METFTVGWWKKYFEQNKSDLLQPSSRVWENWDITPRRLCLPEPCPEFHSALLGNSFTRIAKIWGRCGVPLCDFSYRKARDLETRNTLVVSPLAGIQAHSHCQTVISWHCPPVPDPVVHNSSVQLPPELTGFSLKYAKTILDQCIITFWNIYSLNVSMTEN